MSINTDKDDNFLIWIAKRLVYKYGENKEIISIVESIVQKNKIMISMLDANNTISLNGIASVITNLVATRKNIEDNNKHIVDEFTKLKHKNQINKFENIDLDSLI